jgi:hypothetical protein
MNESDETTADRQFPLAFDGDGNPIDVPAEATAWRVRKLARKAGRPKMIIDPDTGRPLELALTTTFEAFVEAVSASGRYRLEAVDGHGRLLTGCVAVIEVLNDDDGEDHESVAQKTPSNQPTELIQLVAQLVETNSRVMQALASAFGQVHPSAPQPIVIPSSAPAPAASTASNILDNPFVAAILQQFTSNLFKSAAPAANGAVPSPTPSAQP